MFYIRGKCHQLPELTPKKKKKENYLHYRWNQMIRRTHSTYFEVYPEESGMISRELHREGALTF